MGDTINLKTHVVPNWFNKEHIEGFAKRKVSKQEFNSIKQYVEANLMDRISELVMEEVEDWNNLTEKERKEY